MKRRKTESLLVVLVALVWVTACFGQSVSSSEGSRIMHATGTFQVKVLPVEASEIGEEAGLGRMTIDKAWKGDLEGTSKGEMTTTAVDGAMAYVALEKVTARVGGHSGSFILVHRATMMANDPASGVMEIAVMSHSGTGELKGIEGKLQIVIDKSGHHYDFAYTLPQN